MRERRARLGNDAITWLLIGGLYVVAGWPLTGWTIVAVGLCGLAVDLFAEVKHET